MKVLLIAPTPPPYGGIANWTKMILEYAANDSNVVFDHINSANRRRVVDGKNIWDRVAGGITQAIRINAILKRKLKVCKEYDVVHMTTSGSLGIIRDLLLIHTIRRNNIPIVYHIRFGRFSDIAKKHNWEYRLLARAICNCTCVLAIDQKTFKTVRERLPKVRCYCVPNPIDLSTINKLLLKRNADLSRKKELVYCGWVLYSKGIEELLLAWQKVSNFYPDWELKILGPVKEDYKQYLLKNFSVKNVAFMGECTHEYVIETVSNSSIFVFPSHTEGFPNAVVEAMALGTPVIASSVGAIPEMMQNDCGICIQPSDHMSLAEAIISLLNDVDTRRRFAVNAKAKVEKEYEMSAIWKKYCDIWKESLLDK